MKSDSGSAPSAVRSTPPVKTETWYFTFGSGQPHANRYFVVKDATYDKARERMVHAFGQMWGFQYDGTGWHDEDGVSQAERYGLTEIK